MEWTGARYADGPTVEVETFIAASPAAVWPFVADIAAMPTMSPELQRVEWLDGATGPAVGARFVGHNRHPSIGEWSAPASISECDEPTVLGWLVGDPDAPAASWRFTLEPVDGGTRLREWARIGPGRSGLSAALEAMPDKEQQIIHRRLSEFETNMTGTVAAIKQRAEQG